MNFSKCIGRVDTLFGAAQILLGRHPAGGAIWVQLVSDDELCDPLGTFSANLVPYGAVIAHDEFSARVWSENEPLVEPMRATGLFEQTGRLTPSGHVMAPTWRIKDPANVPPARRESPRTRPGAGSLQERADSE